MKKQKILSDFMTVAGGLLKSFEGAKDYSKIKLKDKISLVIEDMNFMKKIELEEMKQMISGCGLRKKQFNSEYIEVSHLL